MIVLESGKRHDAVEIIKENGFIDITPDVSLVTHKFFEKNGKLYMFNGWNRLDENKRWKEVNLIEVMVVPAHSDDADKWIRRYGR